MCLHTICTIKIVCKNIKKKIKHATTFDQHRSLIELVLNPRRRRDVNIPRYYPDQLWVTGLGPLRQDCGNRIGGEALQRPPTRCTHDATYVHIHPV